MTSEELWDLFKETGDIVAYLLYKYADRKNDAVGDSRRERPEG